MDILALSPSKPGAIDKILPQPLHEVMSVVGLKSVKQEFLKIYEGVDRKRGRHNPIASKRLSCTFVGNVGTGKTYVARLYARFLYSIGAIQSDYFISIEGSELAKRGLSRCKIFIDEVLLKGGGVIFIKKASELSSKGEVQNNYVLQCILLEVDRLMGKVVFVLAGQAEEMKGFLAAHISNTRRFPIHMTFDNFNDEELLRILELKVHMKYAGCMKCEEGSRGLYCRIVATRIGRGRAVDGFTNGRAVDDALTQIYRRRIMRLRDETRKGQMPDLSLLTKEDLIGHEPVKVLEKSQSWHKLQKLPSHEAVKMSVKSLVNILQENYDRELAGKPLVEYPQNQVFAGKRSIDQDIAARLCQEIFVELEPLSKGSIHVEDTSDPPEAKLECL